MKFILFALSLIVLTNCQYEEEKACVADQQRIMAMGGDIEKFCQNANLDDVRFLTLFLE